MVRLNKTELEPEQLDVLSKRLYKTIGKLSAAGARDFLHELLGYEERVMLAKRLAAIVLLLEGNSRYRVSQLLKLSESTVNTYATWIEDGSYAELIHFLGKSKKDYFAFLDVLDNILHLGGILPHYNGLDRYKNIR